MSEQATWVPLPRKRVKAAKLPAALDRADRLIDWYLRYRPSVKRVAVTSEDYKAFEEAIGHGQIILSHDGIKYREFLVYVAP